MKGKKKRVLVIFRQSKEEEFSTITACCKRLGISTSTFYNLLKGDPKDSMLSRGYILRFIEDLN